MDEIMWNPYDYMRQEFIETCRKHIKYLKYTDENVLKKLYYQSKY